LSQATNIIAISYDVLQNSLVCPTHRQADRHPDIQTTLRATSVEIGRIYALRAGDAAYKM